MTYVHCLRKAWVGANCGPLPLIYWVFVMPVLVCLLVSKQPVCRVHGRIWSVWLTQDTVPDQWVAGHALWKGDSLGKMGKSILPAFLQCSTKAYSTVDFINQVFVKLSRYDVGEEGFSQMLILSWFWQLLPAGMKLHVHPGEEGMIVSSLAEV